MPTSLDKVSGPERITIWPGLVVEDKLRVKTQRRLERHFNLPIREIFKGNWINPVTKKPEAWEGVNFEIMDNLFALLLILCHQVNENVTDEDIEAIFENMNPMDMIKFSNNVKEYFKKLGGDAKKQQELSAEGNLQKQEPGTQIGA